MNRIHTATSSFALSMTLALALGVVSTEPAVAKKKKAEARYSANAMATGAGGRGSILEVRIDRWSTEEERLELLEQIKLETEGGAQAYRAVPDALRKQKRVGTISVTGSRGYPLRYARKSERDGKTYVVVGTNRPVSFAEGYNSASVARDYDVTVIELILDSDGKGSGAASLATELVWDEADNKLEARSITSQPVRLEAVRQLN